MSLYAVDITTYRLHKCLYCFCDITQCRALHPKRIKNSMRNWKRNRECANWRQGHAARLWRRSPLRRDGAHRGRADRRDHRRRAHPLRPVAPSPFIRVPPSGSLPAVRFTLALLPLWHVVRLADLCSFSLQRGRDWSRSVVAGSVRVRWRGSACPCRKHLCWVGWGWAGLWGVGGGGDACVFWRYLEHPQYLRAASGQMLHDCRVWRAVAGWHAAARSVFRSMPATRQWTVLSSRGAQDACCEADGVFVGYGCAALHGAWSPMQGRCSFQLWDLCRVRWLRRLIHDTDSMPCGA